MLLLRCTLPAFAPSYLSAQRDRRRATAASTISSPGGFPRLPFAHRSRPTDPRLVCASSISSPAAMHICLRAALCTTLLVANQPTEWRRDVPPSRMYLGPLALLHLCRCSSQVPQFSSLVRPPGSVSPFNASHFPIQIQRGECSRGRYRFSHGNEEAELWTRRHPIASTTTGRELGAPHRVHTPRRLTHHGVRAISMVARPLLHSTHHPQGGNPRSNIVCVS